MQVRAARSRSEALRIEGLVQRFGRRVVLDRVDLVVEPGEFVGLVGANGVGKSTLLRCCAGILQPSRGAASVFGQRAARARRRGWIGLAAGGEHRFDRRLSLAANLRHHARLAALPRRRAEARIPELAEAFGVAEHLDTPAAQCSSGARARADLVRALLPAPRLLLLDEPLRSIDAESRARVAAALRERARGAACVWVSHEADDLARRTQRVVRLEKGTLQPGPLP